MITLARSITNVNACTDSWLRLHEWSIPGRLFKLSVVPKVTFIGAGSAVFARQLMTDILQIDGLDEGSFALVDIDPVRLELAQQIAERLIARSGKCWTLRASAERRDVLAGSDFIINSIEVG